MSATGELMVELDTSTNKSSFVEKVQAMLVEVAKKHELQCVFCPNCNHLIMVLPAKINALDEEEIPNEEDT